MIKCIVCSKSFSTWGLYQSHHKRYHNTTDEAGVPRLDLTAALEQARPYVPMDPAAKRAIVEKIESDLRAIAWARGKLNPLMGRDDASKYLRVATGSIEPAWNEKREVL